MSIAKKRTNSFVSSCSAYNGQQKLLFNYAVKNVSLKIFEFVEKKPKKMEGWTYVTLMHVVIFKCGQKTKNM